MGAPKFSLLTMFNYMNVKLHTMLNIDEVCMNMYMQVQCHFTEHDMITCITAGFDGE